MEDKKKKLARQVAGLIEVLPPMPENISRLMKANVDSSKGQKQVRALTANDPGLCTDLLHLACDFCLGTGRTINTIDDAITQIGTGPLVNLIGISYANKTIRKELAALEHLDEYFAHSRDISLCCRILAELCDIPAREREMCAVAGLIHDIGRLIILVASNKKTVHLMGTSWDKMKSVAHNEKAILGLNHCEVGMQLCRKWNFSQIMQDAVLRHHTPLIKKDLNYLGGMIFISHFITFSDFTGQIISTMLGQELLDSLDLTERKFAEAQQIYESHIHKHN
ncbi:MAG: HDOD domain-containing protein [Sedimentisphaerales bacterium]|jgi:HD-like signal output (HDOD) protein